MRSTILIGVVGAALLFSGAAKAQLNVGSRPLGMGGAFTAVSDDSNAPFYNPAGIANLRGFRASFGNVQFRVTGGHSIFDLISNFPSDQQGQIDALTRFGNGNTNADFSGLVAFATKGFGLSIQPFASGVVSPNGGAGFTYVTVPGGASVPAAGSVGDVLGTYGYQIVGTVAAPVAPKTVAGLNLKFVSHRSTNANVHFTDNFGNATVQTSNTDFSLGFGLDLGVQYRGLKDVTVAASMQNILRPNTPLALNLFPFSFNLGAAYRPYKSNLLLAADLTNRENGRTRLNLGAEFTPFRALQFRAGLFDGQPTLGIGIANVVNVAYSPNDSTFSIGISY